jgi:type II secretory pathway pseudopilin PulG
MKKYFYLSNKGFTLLELTATLMIIFFISGFAGFSIVNYIDAYTLQKQHTEIAQQARLVINRLVNEFIHITTISDAKANMISFLSRFNNLKETTISFDIDNHCLKINNKIFADNISDFKLRYLADVNVFDDLDSSGSPIMWQNQWEDGTSTAIQFDISFEISPIVFRKKRSCKINFTDITVVPRTLGALE